MGDILHTLPAVATLKHSFPHSSISWVVSRRWAPLLADNPYLDAVVPFDRRSLRDIFAVRSQLRRERFDLVVDFQGLVQSALIAFFSRAEKIFGYHPSQVRERPSGLFYSHQVRTSSAHIVDHHLELAAAAGGTNVLRTFPVPPGAPEGVLPEGPFVLACPLAGWGAKQWPLDYYSELARMLHRRHGFALLLNGAPNTMQRLASIDGTHVHISGLSGLIHATREAAGVVGLDSGPLHLAAALRKPGVAIYGPTDPARNGPYGDTFTVLRAPGAETSYKRQPEPVASMRAISPQEVYEALKQRVLAPMGLG